MPAITIAAASPRDGIRKADDPGWRQDRGV